MDAILLAGGVGIRLMPMTKHRPKPLMPLANIPFVERTIAWLRDAGVNHVILSLHCNSAQFINHFSAKDFGVAFSFVCEENPLGTGGAISNCATHVRSPRCLIVNGNAFTNLDLRALMAAHIQKRALVSIALTSVSYPSLFGLVKTDPDMRICSFTGEPDDKSTQANEINAGIYVLDLKAFDHFPGRVSSAENDIFPTMLRDGQPLYGFRSKHYWTYLSTPCDYLNAHQDILMGQVSVRLDGSFIRPRVVAGEQIHIASDAILQPPLLLGNHVTIESKAIVGPCTVIGDNVHIGRNAHVQESVLWDQTEVADYSIVSRSIAGEKVELSGRIHNGCCEDFGKLRQLALI